MTSERVRRGRDAGLTLIELVVVITIIGLVVTVLSAAIVVTLRQAPAANARIEYARWEQNLGTWMPADLSSAEIPPVGADGYYDPTAAYAGPAGCGAMCAGDNVLHLEWVDGAVKVIVTYRYAPGAAGEGYNLVRVECSSPGSCKSIVLVRGLTDVDGASPVSAVAPPAIVYEDPNGSPTVNTGGRSVTITINGPDGPTTFTYSGGNTELVTLIPAAIQPPQFLLARSGCGGPVTLIVDESTSLSGNINDVREGVRSFVRAFAGTPTRLQIIAFAADAQVVGATGGAWNKWYDLAEQADVNALLSTSSGSVVNSISPRDATNWEDAFYHAYYAENGQTYQYNGNPAAPTPELIVFFTDGLPTYDRRDDGWGPTLPAGPNPANNSAFGGSWDGSENTQFSPSSWARAQWLLEQNPTVPVIGVGVGSAFGASTDLYRDTTLSTSNGQGVNLWAASRQGNGTGSNPYRKLIPSQLLLGDLVAGNNPATWTTGSSFNSRFTSVAWSASQPANNGWGDISQADLLTTTDFSKFGSALDEIALAECGGTLSVQTRVRSTGAPATESVTYEVTGSDHAMTESTTSAVNKTGVFDIATEGAASEQVLLRPRPLVDAGYTAHHWECRSRNVVINNPSKVSLATPGNQAGGLNVVVAANEALSCVLYVDPT